MQIYANFNFKYHVDFPPCCFAFTHLMAAYFHDRLPTISEVFL